MTERLQQPGVACMVRTKALIARSPTCGLGMNEESWLMSLCRINKNRPDLRSKPPCVLPVMHLTMRPVVAAHDLQEPVFTGDERLIVDPLCVHLAKAELGTLSDEPVDRRLFVQSLLVGVTRWGAIDHDRSASASSCVNAACAQAPEVGACLNRRRACRDAPAPRPWLAHERSACACERSHHQCRTPCETGTTTRSAAHRWCLYRPHEHDVVTRFPEG